MKSKILADVDCYRKDRYLKIRFQEEEYMDLVVLAEKAGYMPGGKGFNPAGLSVFVRRVLREFVRTNIKK